MAVNKTKLLSAISILRSSGVLTEESGKTDARIKSIAEILSAIVGELDYLANPVPIQTLIDGVAASAVPPDVEGFRFETNGNDLILRWKNDSPGEVQYFDLREGSDYENADKILKTSSTRVLLDSVDVTTTTTYLIKAFNSVGNESENVSSLEVSENAPTAVTITIQVIDNNVLLTWTDSESFFRIDHYKLYRDGGLLGSIKGNFTISQNNAGGTYTFKIVPYDVYGTTGAAAEAVVLVDQPPDYELEDKIVDSALDGTLTRGIVENGMVLAPVVTGESWTAHYVTNSKANVQGFIDAFTSGDTVGPWILPSNASAATYVQTFDFGSILTDILIIVDYNKILLFGSVTVGISIQVSDVDSGYSTLAVGSSLFVASVRFVKVTVTLTSTGNTGLTQLWNLTSLLEIKIGTDSGIVTTDPDDTAGTVVTLNKSFRDITSLTATIHANTAVTEPRTVIVDFVDIPNPTTFKVLAFNDEGNLVEEQVYWKARGKI